MIGITLSQFVRSINKYLTLAETVPIVIVCGRWNSKYYLLTPASESEILALQQSDFKVGDKVIVTENVQHNNTGKEFEATIIDIENNPFRGLVLSAETIDKQIYFDIAENFKKI